MEMTELLAAEVCDGCIQITQVQKCARCRIAQYCSKQCQIGDWPAHKLVCGKITKEEADRTPKRYLSEFRRIIAVPTLALSLIHHYRYKYKIECSVGKIQDVTPWGEQMYQGVMKIRPGEREAPILKFNFNLDGTTHTIAQPIGKSHCELMYAAVRDIVQFDKFKITEPIGFVVGNSGSYLFITDGYTYSSGGYQVDGLIERAREMI